MDKWARAFPKLNKQVKADLRWLETVYGAVELQEEWAMDEGFQVTDEYQLGDLSEVKEDRMNVPAASNALLRIQAARTRDSKDGSIKSLAVQVNLVNGVEVADAATGSVVTKYQNKALFADLPFWVDTAIRTTPRYASANKPYLVPLKQFLSALGYDLKSPPKISDVFLSEIIGRELRGDIRLREIRAKNPISGSWEGTKEFVNEIRGFRPA